MSALFIPEKFTGWGSEGVNFDESHVPLMGSNDVHLISIR